MRASRVVLAVLSVLTALVLQLTIFTRVPAPGGRADLVLVVVAAFALAEGPLTGASIGFGAGLLTDLVSDHVIGLYALAFCLTGYFAGLLYDDSERTTLRPLLVVAGATVGATLLVAGVGALLGDPRISWAALTAHLPTAVLYDVILAPFVVPIIGALNRRLDPVER